MNQKKQNLRLVIISMGGSCGRLSIAGHQSNMEDWADFSV
jgi:hypothetical protein